MKYTAKCTLWFTEHGVTIHEKCVFSINSVDLRRSTCVLNIFVEESQVCEVELQTFNSLLELGCIDKYEEDES